MSGCAKQRRALALAVVAAVSGLAGCAHGAEDAPQSVWQEGADGWGLYTDAEYGYCLELPSEPREDTSEDGAEAQADAADASAQASDEGATPAPTSPETEASSLAAQRLFVHVNDEAFPSYMVDVAPLESEQAEELAPMDLAERTAQMYWYAVGFVGSEEVIGELEEAPFDEMAGVRYTAPAYHEAEVWSVLGEDAVYSLVAYGQSEGDVERFFSSFSFTCSALAGS